MRTFTHPEQQKFWTVRREGDRVFTTSGKVGAKGRATEKKQKSEDDAREQMNQLLVKKKEEGYVETTVYEQLPRLAPEGAALEQAVVDDPDDLGAHMAYADWLSEQGDARLATRGELIQVELALEDESKKGNERGKLKRRENKLLAAHQRLYFGELASYLLDGRSEDLRPEECPSAEVPRGRWDWDRGWVGRLALRYLTSELAELMGRSPALRLLRELEIDRTAFVEAPFSAFGKAPALANVRDLSMIVENMTDVDRLIACLPRVEEIRLTADEGPLAPLFRLPNLEHLRLLSVQDTIEDFPLGVLAKNPSLGRLEELYLFPSDRVGPGPPDEGRIRLAGVRALARSKHLPALKRLTIKRTDMGDAGIKEIIQSGMLGRLDVLDLSYGCITDKGARLLAACPEARKLERLGLTENRLTRAGLQGLAKVGIKVHSDYQQQPDENGYYDDGYLCMYQDDWE